MPTEDAETPATRADVSAVSRRRFLEWSLGLGSLVLMGGAGGLLALRGRAPRIAGLRCLTAHEYRTVTALAEGLFPSRDVDLGRMLDAFLADEPPWNRRDMKRALVLLEFGPLLFDQRLTTLGRLPPEERAAHFERWGTSGSGLRRQVAAVFRKLFALGFYDRPEAWREVGYEGPLAHPA
jgi:hypothetical protein